MMKEASDFEKRHERWGELNKKLSEAKREVSEKFPELNELAERCRAAEQLYNVTVENIAHADENANEAKRSMNDLKREHLENKIPLVIELKNCLTLIEKMMGGSIQAANPSRYPYRGPSIEELRFARDYFLTAKKFAKADPNNMLQEAELGIIESRAGYQKHLIGMEPTARVQAFEALGKVSALEGALARE
jgi:chromosome segregation ATPase